MSQAFHLFQLQKIDSQLDQIGQRIHEIEVLLQDKSALEKAEALHQQNLEKLKQAQLSLKKIEQEVQAKRIKLEQSEENLYSGRVKVPKELRDLENEVQALKRALANLEDKQLDAMLEVENAEAEAQKSEAQVRHLQAEQIESQAHLQGELDQLKRSKERLLREQSVILNQIDPENLEIYRQLRANKRGIAVASIIDDACSACGSTLTPAERQAARSPHRLVYCSSCGRILYAG